ncbi:branched-chain amino acid ABC transporter ATP-binding protein/permease [Geoalkalibacter sp.]|uniref:branched-chain amino acid ABC transporter ATP-binding protein/permease n=1 Tax=Geoalkalibacter sp. TaxID=3041440 RepID=UPI00272E9D96|nr:branched-chain amino acid ABC transporter ATP-binding protein/permease [Geoalkalibacter sp.]
MRRILEPRIYMSITGLLLLFLVPAAVDSPFIHHVFVTICLYGALATAWNIVGGYAGQLSLGHASFYGIGGYTAVLLMSHYGISPWIGMIVGAILAAAVGVAISYPCFRLRGPFFALGTIAFLEVFRLMAIHQKDLTGGASGLVVPLKIGWQWMIFREKLPYLIIAFLFLVLLVLVSLWIKKSRFGYFLVAVREREDAAMALGINPVKMKIYAVIISSALTAMIGSFHAIYTTFLEPAAMFSLAFSIQIAMFALIGGLGTVAGPLAGTLLVVPLTEMARGWLGGGASGLHGFVYGVVLVLVVLTLPSGIVGRFGGLIGRMIARMPGARVAAEPEVEIERVAPVTNRTIGEPILVAKSLTKKFGGLVATNDVSIELRKGEILGIIGPNGAGKTTVFNQLSGFIIPDMGKVEVADESGGISSPKNPHSFAKAGVGRTFQIVQPFGKLTVLDNIMIGAFNKYRSTSDARKKALEVAKLVGLFDERNTIASSLTIGGLKRLEVGRVLAMEPRILLLDEVMAGQNHTDVLKAVEMIRRVRDNGVSIIAIEHNMHAIMSISDRVVVINSGSVIAEGAPKEVVQNKEVIEAYLGEEYTHAAA